MDRIEALLAEMTIAEKVGQLNMVASSGVVTGPDASRATGEGIRSGAIGALINLWGADEVQAVQQIAVEESRLKIPLLMGLDVIHGHHTIFPVPLAEACAFDPDLWERTARAAAEEAAADGVALTFAPMIDVARDPRWGRIVESPGEDPWVASVFASGQDARLPGPRSGGCGQRRRHRQAFLRLRRGQCRPGIRIRRRVRPNVARDLLPPFRRRDRHRKRGRHAGLHGHRRSPDDRQRRAPEGLPFARNSVSRA